MPLAVVVWDGNCLLCARTVGFLQSRVDDATFVKSQELDDGALIRMGLTRADVGRSMALYSPSEAPATLLGYKAFASLAMQPGARGVWRLLFRIPGTTWFGGWIYERVSNSRHRLGCGDSCSVYVGGANSRH